MLVRAEPDHTPGAAGERARAAPRPAPAPAVADILALQRGAGNAAVSRMLQRSPQVEYTPSPHRVSLGGAQLTPGIGTKRYPFGPQVRKDRPLAQGSFSVAGMSIGYELKAEAALKSGITFASGPAMLTDLELIARGAEADRLRSRPALIPGLPFKDPYARPPGPRGQLEGSARLKFDAGVQVAASASATLSGGVTALSNAVSAGAYGRLGGSASAGAQLHVDNLIFLTWDDGAISLRKDTIPGFWLTFDLDYELAAEAGIYVELRVPEVPVFTSLYNEVRSWPGASWFLPDLSSLKWRQEYGDKWKLAGKRYRHNVPLDLAVSSEGIDPVVSERNGPPPDELLNDAGAKQKEELKDDETGPGEKKLKGDPASMAEARAAARAQLASTRHTIEREKAVTAKLLAQARRTAAARPATAGGVQMAAIDPPGGKSSAPDTPVEQLERRQEALADADAKREVLEESAKDLLVPAASDDGPVRNKARLGLETVAENADRLGDKVDAADGDLGRATDTGNPADAAAVKELGGLEGETLPLLGEADDAIGTEEERLKTLPPPSKAASARAYQEAHDAYRKAVKKAGAQRTTLEADVKAAQELRLTDPAGAVKKFEGLLKRARKLRDDAAGLAALRPEAPPPASWFGFAAAHNDAFRARLRSFRGTDNVEPSDQGGEGAVFRDGGEERVLKRWYADRLGDMGRSVKLLKATRAAVERTPELSRRVRVVHIHEEGPDWILRDWVAAKQTVSRAPGAQETVAQVVEAIGRLEAAGGLPEELKTLRTRLRERSENLRWDGDRIVVVDMM